MDAPLNAGCSDDALAPLDESRALSVTALPLPAEPCFDLMHPYFEIVYAPSLGPSAIALGRYLGRVLASHPERPVMMCPAALCRELGMRASSAEPLGGRSLLRRSIDRLEHDHLVRWLAPQLLGVLPQVPAVRDRVRDRLPENARRVHDQFVCNVIDLRAGRTDGASAAGPARPARAARGPQADSP